MAYLVELDVDEYGSLSGGENLLPVDTIDHDWYTPYPQVGQVLEVVWEAGDSGARPNVFWHPEVRDWVCDGETRDVLMQAAPQDVHTIARGVLGALELFVVQAVGYLDDVVDREASIIEKYETYEILQFPAFFRSAEDAISGRLFRVPGSPNDVFAGELVKRALEASKTTGLRFVSADWSG